MTEQLKEALQEGEQLLWQGKAENFETLDRTHKQNLIMTTAISLGIALAICIAYIAAAGIANVKPLLILIILLIACIGPFNAFGDGKKLKKMIYAVTDQRILAVSDDVRAVEFDKVDAAEFRRDADGHTSLLLGRDAVKSKATKWRQYTVVGPHMNEEEPPKLETFALYAVNDVAGLKKALSGRLSCLKG